MTRHTRLAIVGIATLLLAACFAGLIYLLSTYPILTRPPAASTAVTWSKLPTPVIQHPQWHSFTAPQTVSAALLQGDLLWAATDGGVIVWEWASGRSVRFTTEHGLAENVVTSAAVGPDGTLWFGTASGGLSRYDGTVWHTFTTADGLPSNHITDLAVTADGIVWAATNKGVGQYDGRRWYSYTRARSFFQLPGENIRALAVAPDGVTVWAATDQGAARFNGRRWQSFAHPGSQSINDIEDIALTPDGMVWAATPGGLKRFDGTKWHIFTSADGLASDEVRRITPLPDNTLWLAYNDSAAGLTLFNPSGSVPTAHTAAVALPVAQPALQVTAVLPTGLLLTVPGGLFYADAGGAERLFRAPADLPNNQLTGLAVAEGAVWASSAEGVSRFVGTSWHTHTTTHGLATSAVSALTLDPAGQPVVAFANASQGIARFDPMLDGWIMTVCPLTGPPSTAVRAGEQTDGGTLWFATNEGLAQTDGQSWRTFTTADGLPSNNVQTIAQSGSQLWAGTDKGLAVFADGFWQTVLADDVRALSSGPDGSLWFFNETGLRHFQPDGRLLTTVPLPPISQVYDQLAAANGFWLATDTGVYFWPTDTESGSDWQTDWQTFATTDGRAMGETTALGQTEDGRLWAGTDRGVWQFETEGVWRLRPLPALANDMPITRLVADGEDALWLGTYEGHVYRFANGDVVAEKPTLLGNEHSPVSAIIPVAEALWVAHFGGGVSRGSGTIGERVWQRFKTDDGLQAAAVNSVAVGQDHAVWLGTTNGLFSLHAEGEGCQLEMGGEPPLWAGVLVDWVGQLWGVNGQTFWLLEDGEKVRSGVLAEPVTAVAADGAVWVVTANGLVRHAHGRRQQISTESLTGKITALAPAADGVIWVGTTMGLFWYDGRVWSHFTAADGLAANHVTHVVIAADGAVWVGTAGGVSWLRP